jgi:hypothetical protein
MAVWLQTLLRIEFRILIATLLRIAQFKLIGTFVQVSVIDQRFFNQRDVFIVCGIFVELEHRTSQIGFDLHFHVLDAGAVLFSKYDMHAEPVVVAEHTHQIDVLRLRIVALVHFGMRLVFPVVVVSVDYDFP